ncbi:MAG: sensor domain-containing diguanylate cyclase [Lachnospiraceae bacterium]|nr:sensor domain-containing diguanylate cyclase [Lachnospiraceae bacterium]
MTQYRYPNSDETLTQIFNYMNALFNEKEFSKTIILLTEMGKALVHSDRASFFFWDKNSHEVWTIAALNTGKITVPEDKGLIGASILNNEVIITNDPYNDPRFNPEVDKSTGYKTKSILTMPVTNAEGKVIGAFQAINKLDRDGNAIDFNEDDAKRTSLASAFCGRSLESYLLYNEALQDQLTGLKNRRGLHSFYENNIAPLLSAKDCSIIMCDIDHFKRVNDTWGHNAGDAILKHVANIFKASIGIDDGVFRWGGEEFIFLMNGESLNEAHDFAEEVRKKIEDSVCHFEGLDLKVTMSFGVSQLSAELTTEENVKIADERLYYAKEHGRNRVISVLPE